jgi:kynureninase
MLLLLASSRWFLAVEKKDEEHCVYLCGHSLGLQPKNTKKLIEEELQVWADR